MWMDLIKSPECLNGTKRPWASLVAQTVKNLPATGETWVWYLGQEDPLEKEMATHSSILAWRIPRTEEPGGLQSIGLQRVGHDWVTNTLFLSRRKNFSCLWTGTLPLYCIWTQDEILPLPGSQIYQPLDWNYIICSFGSQAFRIGLELHFPEFPACSTSIMYLSGRTQGVLTSAIQHYILLVLFHWRNLIHMVWGKYLTSFFCMWLFNYLSPIYWKDSFFPHGIVLEPLQQISWP